jgi:Leucine Rich repeat
MADGSMNDKGFSSSDATVPPAGGSQPPNDPTVANSGGTAAINVNKDKKVTTETLTELPVIPANISLYSEPKVSIHFPVDRSCGDLYIVEDDGTTQFLGEAIGEVRVLPDTRLVLYYNYDTVYGCSRLARVAADALFGISFLGTEVGDSDLQFIEHLTRLEELDIGCTGITDTGLHHIAKLRNLRKLNLSSTRISEAGMPLLSSLSFMSELVLDDTRVGDTALGALTQLSNLHTLSLSFTDVTNKGLSQIKNLTNLKRLRLNSTAVSNAGIDFLTRLTNLQELWLRSTSVSYQGLTELTKWLPSCQIIV